MNNLPIINTPQPSGNATGTSQPDTTGSANNDQASTPFAQVLAHKVDRPASSPASSSKTDSTEQASGSDSAYPAQDQAAVPVDALSAILVQIPVEMRGTSVMDRAALLASGSRNVNHDGSRIDLPPDIVSDAALLPPSSAERETLNTVATRNNQTATVTPEETGITAAPTGQHGMPATTASTDTITAAPVQLLEDPQLQNTMNRPELAIQPLANTAASAATAASIAQSITTAIPNIPTDVRSNTNIQTVSTPLTSPAWPDDFSQKVSWMISQKNQVAELHLNPPNLGPLDIVLKVSDNQATALFASPHANVRDAVENALPKLRELLADNGIMLGNASVSDQSTRDRAAQEFAGRQSTLPGSQAEKEISETQLLGGTTPVSPGRRHNGMVDTYA